MDKSFLIEIENEFKKIDKKWLSLHYLISVSVVILALVLECFIGRIMYITGEINTTIPIYIMKFLVIPSLLNAVCILINYKVIHSSRISQDSKIFTVSLLFVANCFIIFTVHSAFTALFFIFAVPILLTAIYGNYKLSTVTAIFSITALVVSELLIPWDIDKVSVMENGIRLGNFLISVFILMFFFVVSLVIIYFERQKNAAGLQKEMERYKLQQRLKIDDLTGINNRIAFRNAINDMEEDTSENTYIFVMIDIDNFKHLNDSLGHVAGDNCLIEFGKILKENSGDAIPFRYGGDEFSILFNNSTINRVIKICERIQRDFKSIHMNMKTDLSLTASFGVASYSNEMAPSTLIINTDKALYQSKSVKNTITVYNDSMV